MKEGKPFEISKRQVMEAYKYVKAKHGAGGTDGVDFTEFEKDLKNNLYKIWNRMSSGQVAISPPQSEEWRYLRRTARKDYSESQP